MNRAKNKLLDLSKIGTTRYGNFNMRAYTFQDTDNIEMLETYIEDFTYGSRPLTYSFRIALNRIGIDDKEKLALLCHLVCISLSNTADQVRKIERGRVRQAWDRFVNFMETLNHDMP